MRSKLSTITALHAEQPCALGRKGDQSRDEPVPYSLPPTTTRGTPSAR